MPQFLTVADVNGDTRADVLVANNAAGSVSVLLGDGDGSFTAAAAVPVGSNPRGVATGDFDADGDVDIAVSNETAAWSICRPRRRDWRLCSEKRCARRVVSGGW